LVTGSLRRYIEETAHVVAVDIGKDTKRLEDEFEDSVLAFIVHISNEGQVDAMVREAIAHFGQVDVMVTMQAHPD
jgi:NAD(P)-dependent dehydrogenase (short-subunit alcohol dehydrogenase family)